MKSIQKALVFSYVLQIALITVMFIIYITNTTLYISIISISPLMYMLNLIACELLFAKPLKAFLRQYYISIYNELYKIQPLVNGFAMFLFAFSDKHKENGELKKVQMYMRSNYFLVLLIFTEAVVSSVIA